jgi:hypothetical protein
MKPEFGTTSPILRSVFAVCAVLTTSLIAGSIYGLVVHYSTNTQVASTQPLLVAQH